MDSLKFFAGDFELPIDYENCKLNTELNKESYKEIFSLPFVKILCENLTVSSTEELLKNVFSPIQDYFDSCNSINRELEILNTGILMLKLFIQKNWTGPDIVYNETVPFLDNFQNRKNIMTSLALDGENVVAVVNSPEIFYLAKIILEFAFLTFETLKLTKLWYLRSLFIHQQILEEFSPQLYEKMNAIIYNLKHSLEFVSKETAIALHLEFGRIYLYYGNCQKAKIDIQKAIELSGMELSLSGALGKRTKFQSIDLAQLIVKINFLSENLLDDSNNKIYVEPLDLKLDDDVRLDKIKFADNESNYCPNLTALHQATILGHLMYTQKSQPKDNLATEELQPFINRILDKSKSWAIKMTTLLMRSNLHASHKRTVEHSMMQTQILVDALKNSKFLLEERLLYFFTSYLPPKWHIKSTLANILVSIGSIKSALEIYLVLEDWENIINCYNALQLRHKAQEIIEQELAKSPTPKLWCLLGDATDDTSCYEKAWKLSKEKSARSQRHWALFYYYRKNYAASIEHFQKSLEINSLQNEIWYKLAYAALVEEKWEISAHAYRRYVVLDPECFEAWNNLGRCYCELKQKQRAHKALQEALKIDNLNWRVWDNYMIVSHDLKEFNEVIKSYNEILNLKEKHVDIPILNYLVENLKYKESNHESDKKEIETTLKYRSKLMTLFGRLTSQVINNSELWLLYSEIVVTDSPENLEKKRQLLLKAHRSAISKINWEKDLDNCNRIIYILSKLIQVGLLIQKPDVLMSCKLASDSALAKIKKEQTGIDISDNILENLKKLENALNTLNG